MDVFTLFVLLLQLHCALSKVEDVSYDNYRIYEVSVNSRKPLDFFPSCDNNIKVLREYQVDEGTCSKIVRSYLVAPNSEMVFRRFLTESEVDYKIVESDLGKAIEEERQEENFARRSFSRSGFDAARYYSYDEIVNYLKWLKTIKGAGDILELENIGKTYEGRDMYMAKISSNHSMNKPIIFFEALMHAREWTASSAALYMINQLVENYTHNQYILKSIDFYIIPVSNPDGYEYSREEDRFWRKTRSFNDNTFGVDGNRNFDFNWGKAGTSNRPGSDIYRGPYPFSEIETRNIRDVGMKYRDRINMFVSVHAYGPFILYPWGYSESEIPPRMKAMEEVADSVSRAIREFSGTYYLYGRSSVMMYPAAGGSDDYFKGVLGVDLSFTIELSSGRIKTFIVPASRLPRIVSEAFVGFQTMAKYAAHYKKKYYKKK